jgi:hypothetical protein
MSQPSETSFHLFTSLRYDPLLLRSPSNSSPTLNFTTPSPFYMLVYHRDRMLEAAQHFDFHAVASYLSDGAKLHQTLLDRVWEWIKMGGEDGPLKLRLLFDRGGKLEVEIGPLPKVPLSTLYPESLNPPPSTPERHPADTSPAAASPDRRRPNSRPYRRSALFPKFSTGMETEARHLSNPQHPLYPPKNHPPLFLRPIPFSCSPYQFRSSHAQRSNAL